MNNEIDLNIPIEFDDFKLAILPMGAKKHGMNSFLQPGVFRFGPRLASLFRHTVKAAGLWDSQDEEVVKALLLIQDKLTESQLDLTCLFDNESGESHMLHAQCNAAMMHTVIKRGILK